MVKEIPTMDDEENPKFIEATEIVKNAQGHMTELLRTAVREGEEAYARGEFVELAGDEIGPYIASVGRTARQRKRA